MDSGDPFITPPPAATPDVPPAAAISWRHPRLALRQLLERQYRQRGRLRVEQELHNRPQLQTELMCTIGNSLYALGAQTEARRTFDGIRTVAPPECLIAYADLLAIIGDYPVADSVLRAAERAVDELVDRLVDETLDTRLSL